MKRSVAIVFALVVVASLWAQSGLDKRSFGKYWTVESESADYCVTFHGDTCELFAPKGLTLWRNEQFVQGQFVEYDATVVDEGLPGDRLSDMNLFWLASDVGGSPSVFSRMAERQGVFQNCYALQMYYLGYGGNHNSTTRFRRYEGGGKVPPVWKEFTDAAHLLRSGHWYHWRVESTREGRTRIFVDGELLVDYLDPQPLQSGWFGFRTTLSRTRITNFTSGMLPSDDGRVPLRWVGRQPATPQPVTFGIPFASGQYYDVAGNDSIDAWVLARWPDGSVKWAAFATVAAPSMCCYDGLSPSAQKKQRSKASQTARRRQRSRTSQTDRQHIDVRDTDRQLVVCTRRLQAFIPKSGPLLLDSLLIDGLKVGTNARLVATTDESLAGSSTAGVQQRGSYVSHVDSVALERVGNVSAVVKISGHHEGRQGRCWLPFVLRLYFWQQSEQVKLVHTFVYDGDQNRDFIASLGLQMGVPMRAEAYNRHIFFATDSATLWHEPVQPLDGRAPLDHNTNWQQLQMDCQRIPARDKFSPQGQQLLQEWAQWDGFRLSQLTDNAFAIRKRAVSPAYVGSPSVSGGSLSFVSGGSPSSVSDGSPSFVSGGSPAGTPWIGTLTGHRSPGFAFVGDADGGLGIALKDFWQSYPSTMQIDHARSQEATLTMFLWSPETEPMNLCHYDTIAHGLLSSYEDVQEGLSTPYGIARTSTLWLLPYTGKPRYDVLVGDYRLLPTPDYLHAKRAFGVWSLYNGDDTLGGVPSYVEKRLNDYITFYQRETERCKWYGFWNYGDVMHAYDEERNEWRYDVGGYAWDNTELATPLWLWYNFVRTGRADIWRMAEAMTRHNSEVDTYHIGPLAPLGSRHNVSHWGCGAKEARISQSAFLRFYYYLTADERTGDLMHAQTDCDTLLYHLDPMRLAEPRAQYPCHAPARLRLGPDWLAYAGNWMTEWERSGNTRYRDKILTGMQSIAQLKHGFFTGNKALGYDPATGRITYDGPDSIADMHGQWRPMLNTNHLATIMGGFEVMNELLPLVDGVRSATDEAPALTDGSYSFGSVWLDHARRYRQMALEVSRNKFPVRRLDAYAAWQDRDPERRQQVWQSLLKPQKGISTNDAALWSLDAIYMLETIRE